ncbi:cam1p [Saccharomyces arboricola H-6]|uniref:Cam1p n=1 Tax=Saccharomyces arboricola (strain H-6 / AS 2.3317 / CBS 10644) TaxID=1160507 RepID=J8PY65_SACAR|nr:cam1p [Saccharomyces arboricola H-6]
MSQGTLYANFRIRTWVPRSLVRVLKLDVNVVVPDTAGEQFARDFPLKKVPAFVGPKGYKLTEAMAINYYLIKLSQDEKVKAQLLGADDDLNAQAQIIRWQSLANNDLCTELVNAIGPLRGDVPYNKKNVDAAMGAIAKIVDIFDARLKNYTYLATESISLADLVAAAIFTRHFQILFGSEWRAQHPAIVRWFNTVRASHFLKDEYTDFKFTEKPMAPPQKKNEKKAAASAKANPSKKKEAAKPAAAAAAETEAPAKKPKHPLEALGKSTFILDDWKRKYSNEDTRPVALPWFWEQYNPEEYSIWKVTYKYNDELTMTFMSNNLVGGFFNRLSASTKYMFGCLVVYGENNNNGIVGAIMIRGQDYVPAFNVAPDWESYDYAKLDPTNEDDKEFVNNMWAWDKPVSVNGEPKEIVDGKVLK